MATVSNQPANHIDQEICETPMTRMLNLRDILELVNNAFDNRPATKQNAIRKLHQPLLHVLAHFGDQAQIEPVPQSAPQRFGEIAFVAKELAKQLLDQPQNRFAVIHIAGREAESQDFTPLIDHQMQFEAKKPAARSLTALRQRSKNLVSVNALVATDR